MLINPSAVDTLVKVGVVTKPTTGANIPEHETLRAAEKVPFPEPHLMGMDGKGLFIRSVLVPPRPFF